MRNLLTVFLLFSSALLLGLSGQHSVGGAGANYTTLTEAITALNSEGLSGDCELIMNAGTYSGPFVLSYSANGYDLTIRPATGQIAILNNPSSSSSINYIMKIASVSGIRLQGLRFQGEGSYSRALQIENSSDDLQITGCAFQGVFGASSSNSEAIYFYASGSGDADQVYIALNSFYDGGYGIAINSASYNDNFADWQIYNNYFTRGYAGTSLLRMNNLRIHSNTFEQMYSAINLNTSTGSLDISRNKVSSSSYGITVSYASVNTTVPHIFNNVISVNGFNGLNINGNGLNIFHNSVESNSEDSYQRYAAVFSGSDLHIRKNHFFTSNNAIAVNISSVDPSYSQRNIMEHNNIYSSAFDAVQVNNDRYRTVEDYNIYTECENLSYYPGFSTDLLITSSAAMDNAFASTELNVDYNGFPRDPDFSDIGAHEYSADPSHIPLAGTFHVGNGQYFTTIQDFATALHQRGVNGAVTAYLNDPLYEEQVRFFTIPGASYTNQVALRSTSNPNSIVRYSAQTAAANYVFQLNRISYLLFRNIDFQTYSTTYSNLILNKGYNSRLDIQYCNFTAPTNASGSSIAIPYGYEADNYDLLALSFVGNYFGLEVRGKNWDIVGSSFDNQYNGIFGQVFENLRVEYCLFQNSRNTNLHLNQAKAAIILNNRITSTKHGIGLYQDSTPGSSRSLIANNTIDLSGNNVNGISAHGNMISVLNNSVKVSGDYSYGLYSYQGGTNIDIVNNILSSIDAHALNFGYYTADPSLIIDYNCYYSEGNSLIKLGGEFPSLAEIQTAYPSINQHSVALNPHYSADMHTLSPWLREAGMFRTEISTDMDYEPRGESFDIGADQQSGQIVDNRLSGTYTIGATNCDYPTLEAAIADLELNGVIGNVIFNITAGTYTGYYTIRDFPKAEPNQTVTFNGLEGASLVVNPVPGQAYDNYIFRLAGAKNIILNSLQMSRIHNNNYCTYIVLDGRCENISITNSSFNLYGGSQSNSNAIDALDNQGINLLVENCSFISGNYGISMAGPYWGTLSYTGVQVLSCDFTEVRYPVTLQKAVNIRIIGNQITSPYQALNLSYIIGTNQVKNNKIRAGGFAGSYSSYTIVNLSNCNGSAGSAFQLINNIIYVDQSSAQAVTAMAIAYSSHIYMNHNTVISDNKTYYEYGSALDLSQVSYSSFWNNILSSPSSGYAAKINACTDYYFQNNAWYNSAMHIVSINGVLQTKTDLLSTIDPQGYIANPLPNTNGYSQCSYLQSKAAASTNHYDIDGNSFGTPADLGASVITYLGPAFSGYVTIGSVENFTNLDAFFDAILKRGISGDLVVQINPGTYNTSAYLGYVPGSHVHQLRLIGSSGENAPILSNNAQSSSGNFILTLHNTYNLGLQDIAFQAFNPSFSRMIKLERYTENLEIDNCSFGTPVNTGSSQDNVAVQAYDIVWKNISITNSTLSNLPMGFFFYGTQNQTNNGLVIEGNDLGNCYQAMYFANTTDLQVLNNEIANYRYMGISLYGNISSSLLQANSITGNGNYALYLNGLGNGGEHRIFSNYLHTEQNATTTLYVNNTSNVKLFHNTVVNSYPLSAGYAFYSDAASTGLSFQNNICVADQGLAAQFPSLSNFSVGQYSHNLYYGAGSDMVKLGSVYFSNSLSWNQATGDQYSIFENPLLEEDSYVLLVASPARNKGLSQAEVSQDIVGNQRDNPPDLGCYETYIESLVPPQNPHIVLNPGTESLTLSWDIVPGAGLYIVQTASDPLAVDWVNVPGANTGQLSIIIPIPAEFRAFYRIKAIGPQ